MTTLLSSRLKLERAREHIKTLHAGFQAYMDSNPHRVTQKLTEEGWYTVSVEIVRPMPETLSLIAGDAIHCIRSALDHAVYAVSTGAANKRRGYWPICVEEAPYLLPRGKRPNERPSMREEGLGGVPEPIRAIIDETQPYHGGVKAKEHVFAVISRLDNADKHRVVQPAVAVFKDPGTIDASLLMPGQERTLREEWFEGALGKPLRLNHKADILRWRVDPPTDQVKVKLNPTMTIVFGEGGNFDQVWAAHRAIYKLIDRIETAVV